MVSLGSLNATLAPLLLVWVGGACSALQSTAKRYDLHFRRRCPGMHFANALVFLVIARVLAVAEILPDPESEKDEISARIGLVAYVFPRYL